MESSYYQLQPSGVPLRHPEPSPGAPAEEESQQDAASQAEARSYMFCYGTLHILFADRKFADVTFSCNDGVQVDAHKFILATRSEHFKKSLYEKKGDQLDENCKHKHYQYRTASNVLIKILEYLYTGFIAELEQEETIEDEQRVKLWKSLLGEALEKPLGHLDKYLSMLLVRRKVSDHSIAASLFTFAMEKNMDEVACAMARILLDLPFTEDCLQQLSEDALVRVLSVIPFAVNETEVIRAVHDWAQANLMDEDDTVAPEIMQNLDLDFVSADDLYDVIEPFKLFDEDAMSQAWAKKALNPGSVTCQNTKRGRGCDWMRQTALLDDAVADETISQLQGYTTFVRAGDSGLAERGVGRPATIIESAEFGSEAGSSAIRD